MAIVIRKSYLQAVITYNEIPLNYLKDLIWDLYLRHLRQQYYTELLKKQMILRSK